jgi:hypothetical protein
MMMMMGYHPIRYYCIPKLATLCCIQAEMPKFQMKPFNSTGEEKTQE